MALIIYPLQDIVCNRNDSECLRVKAYYAEPKDSLDVVVMGASEVLSGYVAGEAYKEAGFTSFPYSFTINSVVLWKYELRDIERTQHPKLLIIETNGALYEDDEYIHSDHCLDTLADNMPMSKNRIDLAFDLSNHPLERLFPIIKYHYKWSEIQDLDENNVLMLRKQGYARLRGAQSFLYRKEKPSDTFWETDDSTADLNKDAEAALEDFLKECKKSGIENILFVEYPHLVDEEDCYRRQQRANRAAQMIQDAGFEYVSFIDDLDEIGLDPVADFADSDHMSAPGQKKFTRYLTKFIMDRYDIQPRPQTAENKARWEDSAALTDSYYALYDSYTKAHSDDPYKKAEFLEADNVRTMEELENLK